MLIFESTLIFLIKKTAKQSLESAIKFLQILVINKCQSGTVLILLLANRNNRQTEQLGKSTAQKQNEFRETTRLILFTKGRETKIFKSKNFQILLAFISILFN